MSTEEGTTMTSSVSVPAAKLRDMLAAVIPHADNDYEDSLPALEGVRFEVRAGTLFLVATDRYSIGIARCRIPGAEAAPVPDASAILPLDAVRELNRDLESADGTAALVFGEDSLTTDTGDATGTWVTDSHLEHFPDWRKLMHDVLAGDPAELGGKLGVSPVHLAKFALSLNPADDRRYCDTPLRVRIVSPSERNGVPLHSGERQPVILVTRGDWFLGALMPTRFGRLGPDAPPQPEPWAEWAAVTAPAEKPEAA
jgi:hypothetical protein